MTKQAQVGAFTIVALLLLFGIERPGSAVMRVAASTPVRSNRCSSFRITRSM